MECHNIAYNNLSENELKLHTEFHGNQFSRYSDEVKADRQTKMTFSLSIHLFIHVHINNFLNRKLQENFALQLVIYRPI